MSDDAPELTPKNMMKQLVALFGRKDAFVLLKRILRELKIHSKTEAMNQEEFLTLCDGVITAYLEEKEVLTR